MRIFRIHIRPPDGSADMQSTFAYCIENGVLGVGGRTNSNRNTRDWDEYYKEASELYDNLKVCKYIHTWVKEGDLVWTRSPSPSQYYLARVSSPWEYWISDDARTQDIDIANIFRCDIRRVEIDEVPGKVVNCFRARMAIQEISDDAVYEYSNGDIDNSSLDERPAVIDHQHRRAIVGEIGYADMSSKWQRTMRASHVAASVVKRSLACPALGLRRRLIALSQVALYVVCGPD